MDETGWRLHGSQRALWGAFTGQHAYFQIAPDRHEDHAKALLAHTTAIVTSDRWWAYSHLPLTRRQICWAHLRRDFTAHAEGLAVEKQFSELGLHVCERLFWAWEVFQRTHDRRDLARQVPLLRREMKPALRRFSGKSPRNKYCRGMACNLLKLWPRCGLSPPSQTCTRQQPRRAIPPRRRHLPQAQPRQPIRTRRATRRPPALRLHHLPPTATQPARLPRRSAQRARPGRPSPTAQLKNRQGLNAYLF